MTHKQTALPLIVCALILSTSGCSKHFSKNSSKNPAEYAEQIAQVETTQVNEESIVEREIEIVESEPKDTIIADVVPIPQEDEFINSIKFSEEQSQSIILPEYSSMNINDLSLILTEMDSTQFHYPAAKTSYTTSPYGWRHGRMHTGVDIKVFVGDDIYAAFDGVVRIAKYYGAYGNCVVIRHDNGLETLYAHSSKLLVEVNDVVKAGQVIALGGSTGRSTGSHLHFEVRVAGNYINPNLVIDTKNHSLQNKNLYITRRNNRIFASNNDDAEEREADIIEELSIRYYTVRSGDVLSRIAVRNHTTVSSICRLNNISSRSTLRIGQRLIVRDGIRPTTSSTKKVVASSSSSNSVSSSKSTSVYTVRSGDTLSKIARESGTSISTLCQLNSISTNSTLRVGQKLQVEGTISEQNIVPSSYYTIKSGDTLLGIALRNNTTVKNLCALNNLSSTSTLRIGQKLVLSGSSASKYSSRTIYTVKSGDTLSQIAENNNTTVSSICRLNNITSRTTLKIGQKLKIA